MTDIKSKIDRSKNMSAIRSSETKPEVIVRKFLFANGFRYRKNDRRFPGTPDIVLPKYKTVIFVNGCFWHRHSNCRYAYIPKTNTEFWKYKFYRNVERDRVAYKKLEDNKWKVIIVWECELKRHNQRENKLEQIKQQLLGNE